MRTAHTHLSAFLGIVIVLAFASRTLAQSALNANCDLGILGVSGAKHFLTFDKELKESLESKDSGKLALLLKYPFRINDDRGSYYLHDAASFSARAEEVFTASVRDAILKRGIEAIWCNYTGITYGDGVVWVNPTEQSFAIEAVNLPAKSGRTVLAQHATEFICRAEKHRVIVDHGPSGKLRYRSWNKPRSLVEKPDLEISDGKEKTEGSGACVYAIWEFSSGSANFSVSQLGACDPGVPNDAIGSLEVSVTGSQPIQWWCH